MKNSYDKHAARTRRGAKHKARLKHSTRPRLVVFRSNLHIYAQVVIQDEKGSQVLAAAGTVDKNLKSKFDKKTKVEQALEVGKLLAERAKEKQIKEVVFDRAGYKYHGRVKALADGAREAGLNF